MNESNIVLSMSLPSVSQGWNYQPLRLEKHTDSVIGWVSTSALTNAFNEAIIHQVKVNNHTSCFLQASVLWSLSYYSSPLLLCYLYRKGGFDLVSCVGR